MNASPSFRPSIAVTQSARRKNPMVLGVTADASAQKGTGSLKALLVDDNVDLLEMAAVLFGQLGFEVHTATSGDEALEVLRHTSDFDLLFTDVVMPGISGIQLGNEARKLYPELKIVLVSGFPQKAIAAGHGSIYDFDFLNKPYRLEEIAKLLSTPN